MRSQAALSVMSLLQQYQIWIGLGFVIVLVAFAIIAFFTAKNLTPDQRTILKFLCSLCAGFAGALISGDALLKLEGNVTAGTKYSVMGTVGFALFFAVWFFFPTVVGFPPAYNFTVPQGWPFKETVDSFAAEDGAVVDYQGFTATELQAPLKGRHIKTSDPSRAIARLRSVTESEGAIREYDVKFNDSTYTLKVKS